MNANEVIGYISAIQTLVNNFPMSMLDWLLSKGKRYTSVLDFVLDVIFYCCGEDIEKIYNEIIEKILGVNVKVMESMNNVDDSKLENPIFDKFEDVAKGAIASILTAILSCSAIPEIPDDEMYGVNDNAKTRFNKGANPLTIPVSAIDFNGKLNINPTQKIGKCFYDLRGDETGLTPNTMYKAEDLDAFIWYVLNMGDSSTSVERTKMMWDNRLKMKYKEENRNSDSEDDNGKKISSNDKWNYWLTSSSNDNDELHCYGDYESLKDKEKSGYSGHKYYPIIQFQADNTGAYPRLKLWYSYQRYHGRQWGKDKTSKGYTNPWKIEFNHTMFKFNWEYLSSINIFSVRVILANLMNSLINGWYDTLMNLDTSYGYNLNCLYEQISKAVSNIVMQDDMEVSDCVFTFSNDDYNDLLYKNDLKRYNIQKYNSETGQSVIIDKDTVESAMNSISPDATSSITTETIQKAVYDVSATAQTGSRMTASFSSGLVNQFTSQYMEMIYNLIMSIIMPIVQSLMSPKIVLLFVMNFQTTGLLDMKKILSGDATEIFNIVYAKLLTILKKIILYIKDAIVMLLLEFFYEKIAPLLYQFILVITMEKLEDWKRLLDEALKCIPIFDISIPKMKYGIDDVDYADIEQSQDTPESTTNC